MIFNIIFLVTFLLFSAFFSASETAIFSLKKADLRKLKEVHPPAKKLDTIFKNASFYLTTIVFGNMLVNIGLASLVTFIFVNLWGEKGVIFSIIFSGAVILFLGEVFPKTIAIYTQEKVSLFAVPVLIFMARVFYPLLRGIQRIVDAVSRRFFRGEKKQFGEEEIKEALFLGKKDGHITEAEEEMISYVLEFKDTWVSEIMTPRVEIRGINIESTQEEVLSFLKKVRHSKFPVYVNSLDNIVGIIYAKDIFLNPKNHWKDFIREPKLVPESKRIDDLLRLFLQQEERIAIVLDEYGGTAGLVTLEDIEEELFGEIYDEFEVPYNMIEKVEENSWRVYGKIPIKTLNLELELDLPEETDTLAGLILSHLERIPRAGEKFKFKEIEFTIERATARRVISVIIRLKR